MLEKPGVWEESSPWRSVSGRLREGRTREWLCEGAVLPSPSVWMGAGAQATWVCRWRGRAHGEGKHHMALAPLLEISASLPWLPLEDLIWGQARLNMIFIYDILQCQSVQQEQGSLGVFRECHMNHYRSVGRQGTTWGQWVCLLFPKSVRQKPPLANISKVGIYSLSWKATSHQLTQS